MVVERTQALGLDRDGSECWLHPRSSYVPTSGMTLDLSTPSVLMDSTG